MAKGRDNRNRDEKKKKKKPKRDAAIADAATGALSFRHHATVKPPATAE